MLQYIKGNLLESKSQALVNTVNTVGVMGKGIALQFKNFFPNNFREYQKACKEGKVEIGKLFITEEESLTLGKKIIINFPTKTDWRKTSEYNYIEEGLKELQLVIQNKKIESISIPPLGAGQGGLNWIKVKSLLNKYLSEVKCDIYIFEPDSNIQEVLKKERAKLTPARAMLLYVLYDLVRNGEFVSEFASEKISYFLQRMGAGNEFKLTFAPNFYGPYSGKVKHVLYILNGSYITGYSSKDKKPFEELSLMMDAELDIKNYLENLDDKNHLEIAEKTRLFLTGFYSSFALELLSTIDYIMLEKKVETVEKIGEYLSKWSNRKKTLFYNPEFISMAMLKNKETFIY
jgi:O-acetyl-ADP-ribose deacetylase (regulator of RNase III)